MKRQLTCCCCGGDAGRFDQHWNRDTGYGICAKCIAWLRSGNRESEEEIRQNYGKEGVNFAAPKEPQKVGFQEPWCPCNCHESGADSCNDCRDYGEFHKCDRKGGH